eukprot:6726952-Heterocapsa_arctica.AAC.1
MKYREKEDLINPNNFWQEQVMITDFPTGFKRSVNNQNDTFKWLRRIGISRLANTPDGLSTE